MLFEPVKSSQYSPNRESVPDEARDMLCVSERKRDGKTMRDCVNFESTLGNALPLLNRDLTVNLPSFLRVLACQIIRDQLSTPRPLRKATMP